MIIHFKSLFRKVWLEAAHQVLFSLTCATGGFVTIANSNKFKTNIFRDAVTVTITDTMTSILAGLVVFSFMGFVAKKEGIEMDNLKNSTLTDSWQLSIITSSYISSKLTILPQLFSVMASLMFLTFGIDSMYTATETVIVAVSNSFKVIYV